MELRVRSCLQSTVAQSPPILTGSFTFNLRRSDLSVGLSGVAGFDGGAVLGLLHGTVEGVLGGVGVACMDALGYNCVQWRCFWTAGPS